MENLKAQCDQSRNYPKNLFRASYEEHLSRHLLDLLFERLNDQDERLFSVDSKASLDFLELNHEGKGTLVLLP